MKEQFLGSVVIGDSRFMAELSCESVDLVVTSPPYWHIKDYEADGQIGYGQTLHEYLKDLCRVWAECHRVLRPSKRLCVNIGDQFARQAVYGRYKVIPLHSEVIAQCESIGFDYMGSIIWQKKTTMETSGGAVVMGSYPYPPNGIVELDYEFILLFKKPGNSPKFDPVLKEKARLSRDEWKEYFSGHWYFGGTRQKQHEAMFPDELPRRLIKMFTFPEEVVLDPFLGSGTTIRAALSLDRKAVGYELNRDFVPIIQEKLSATEFLPPDQQVEFIFQQPPSTKAKDVFYVPGIQDASPLIDPKEHESERELLYKVVAVIDASTLKLESGQAVRFLGVRIDNQGEAIQYLREMVVGKQVYVRTDNGNQPENGTLEAYIYLKNKIFVNSYLIRSGIGSADTSRPHKLIKKFKAEQEKRAANIQG